MCLDTRWRCVEGEKYPFNWIGGWLGPTTKLHAVEKKKIHYVCQELENYSSGT